MAQPKIKSVLAVECGTNTTTAVLIEKSGQQYQLKATGQAPSTYASPWEDITLGVRQAVRHIEKVVKRTILTPHGWPLTPQNPARQGVDAFVVVSSAGPPLKVMIAGLMNDISLTSAKRAATATYTRVTNVISLDSVGDNLAHSSQAQIKAVQQTTPEVILLVGGIDGGAEEPVLDIARTLSAAMFALNGERPTILYAGNNRLRPHLADILGPVTALKSVNNVRPTLDIEDLSAARQELEALYVQKKMLRVPGFDKLKNWSQFEAMPASKSFEKLVTYIGQHNNLNVLGANIGSRSTVLATKHGEISNSTVRSDLGIGHSLSSLLEIVPVKNIHRWLPFDISEDALYNQLLNKSLYPATIPPSREDLIIEHAIAREALRLALKQAQGNPLDIQWNLIVGAGRTLTGTPQAAEAALMLIDGLEPWGVSSLALDKSGMVNLLGTIALAEPLAAVQLAQADTFLNLGTVVAPAGHGQRGKSALKIKLARAGSEEVEEKEILYGDIELLPLPAGETASLEIRPGRHFDIGLGQPGRGAVAQVEGGLLGVIIDARGRPLQLPGDTLERQQQLKEWFNALGVHYATPIDYD